MSLLLGLAFLALLCVSTVVALPLPINALSIPSASSSDPTYAYAYEDVEGSLAHGSLIGYKAKGIGWDELRAYIPVDRRDVGRSARRAAPPYEASDLNDGPGSQDVRHATQKPPTPMTDRERSEALRSVLISELKDRYANTPGHFWTKSRGRVGKLYGQHST